MYTGRKSSWLREDEANRPWQTWRVPVSSRPAQEVQWRDVVILDENNEFYAVQNLTEETLSNGANRDKLKSILLAAATISDTDIDGIPDRWEFQHLGGINNGAATRLSTGQTALVAYATSQPPSDFRPERNVLVSVVTQADGRFLEMQFRRRLGGEGQRLIYQPQLSTDGETWSSDPDNWSEISATNPWDGSGTEIVRIRTTAPESTPLLLGRIKVESPQ
ncbi:MAG: hypothetical protein KDN22_23800 [Verrucomicrobiae bacterium]|nr:hypothetical protein [Verrucomicrobiae bacterium]